MLRKDGHWTLLWQAFSCVWDGFVSPVSPSLGQGP